MADLNATKEFKKAVELVVKEVLEKETRSCFRVYKASVVTPPYYDGTKGNICSVRLVGDSAVLDLPYSSKIVGVAAGDTVWVGVIGNSFRNAIVWEKRFFE